jgi:hypothetical protein
MTTLPSRPSLRTSEHGSVLIIAVIAVLLVSIMLSSLSVLGKLEATIGLNYKSQAQAEATAEAGLDWARDQVRTAGAAGVGTGFTPWFDGTKATHMLTSGAGQSVGQFKFNVRIDNDCAAYNTVSSAIQESSTCTNSTDTNETAVLTSWATVGTGNSRVRAAIYIDNPWKHVCSNSQNDPGGPFCNSAGNTKGNPAVTPADPQDTNGPRGYVDLPRPVIGCSRIDPSVHTNNPTTDCPSVSNNLYSQPALGTTYPAFPAVPANGGPVLVIMGDDPALTATAKSCGEDYQSPSKKYFGYFDCALRTPCPASLCGTIRKGCIRGNRNPDTGADLSGGSTDYWRLGSGVGYDGTTCGANTGMVWSGSQSFANITIGAPGTNLGVLYIMHDKGASMATSGAGKAVLTLGPQPNTYINGTVVVEGDAITQNWAILCVNGPAPSPLPPNPCPTPQTGYSATKGYGYPLALMSYDPKLPYPTVSPQAPQPISVNFGSNNTMVNGSVYSGGQLTFNPINVNGTSIAFNIDLQSATSTYNYVPQYGNDAPPAGFLPGTSDPVVMLPKSFITCNNYHDDSPSGTPPGPTACQ